MRRPSGRRSSVGLAIILFIVIASLQAQSRQAYWFTLPAGATSPLTHTVGELVRNVLRATYPQGADVTSPPSAVYQELRNLWQRGSKDLIFIVGDTRGVAQIVRDDEGWSVLSDLGLEAVNARLAAAPFYLFSRAPGIDSPRRPADSTLRIAYAATRGGLTPAAVATLLQKPLGAKLTVLPPLASPRALAQRLAASDESRVDFVGIHDEDPSLLLHDFLTWYARVRPAGESGQLKFARFPTSDSSFTPERLSVAEGGLNQTASSRRRRAARTTANG